MGPHLCKVRNSLEDKSICTHPTKIVYKMRSHSGGGQKQDKQRKLKCEIWRKILWCVQVPNKNIWREQTLFNKLLYGFKPWLDLIFTYEWFYTEFVFLVLHYVMQDDFLSSSIPLPTGFMMSLFLLLIKSSLSKCTTLFFIHSLAEGYLSCLQLLDIWEILLWT